jgi:hypothetical protein
LFVDLDIAKGSDRQDEIQQWGLEGEVGKPHRRLEVGIALVYAIKRVKAGVLLL